MKYTIVKSGDVDALERVVNSLVEEGFKPLGGILIIPTPHSNLFKFYQTMFKDK